MDATDPRTIAVDQAIASLSDIFGGQLPELELQSNSWTLLHYLRSARGDDRDPFDFDAPYQRGAVWTLDQKRNLIRSIVMGIPIGAILIAEDDLGKLRPYRVVDGKQRILAVREFEDDGFTVPAAWFPRAHVPAGKTEVVWSDLSRYVQRGIENQMLPALHFASKHYALRDPDTGEFIRHEGKRPGEKGGAKRVKLTPAQSDAYELAVYLLINAAGTPHTASDLGATA